MNAIDDTRQIFGAKIEALEAKIDGKLALIFQRLDAMPDRAEMHKAISDAVDPLRKLIIGTAFAATGTILSLMIGLRALNIDILGMGFDIAQIIVERDQARDKKHYEEMQAMRNMIIDNRNMIVDNAKFLRELREELLRKSPPHHP
ncbi:MAG TPA: hypothetical protein VHR67_05455 [Aestuariivirgaceae bacterium]|jgi:hypothetical protein|nr:hypothetical protein [Aestuariivirgaceae bacterium]